MTPKAQKAVLNRAVFTQQSFDSQALTVLTTLFHHFPEAGDYEIFIQRDGKLIRRLHAVVAPENSELQRNLDMAAPVGEESGCGCEAEACYQLAVGAVLGFYVSQGRGRYSVRISRTDNQKRAKRTLLDSQKLIPAGDLFAVTLVRPGVYRVRNSQVKGESIIRVGLPRGKGGYRTDQPSLVQISKTGTFRRRSSRLLAGQSLVFQCNAPAHIQVELVEAADVQKEPEKHKRSRAKPSAKKRGK